MDGISHEPAATRPLTHASPTLVGRDGVIRNMFRRLGRGEWLAVYGGPGLGKTSLLLELKRRFDVLGSLAHYGDLSVGGSENGWRTGTSGRHDAIALLDNCDALVHDRSRLQNVLHTEPRRGMVLAGGRLWYETFRQHEWGKTLRRIPLAVLLDKDARTFIRSSCRTTRVESILTHAGTHPRILQMFCSQGPPFDADADSITMLSMMRAALEPLFLRCLEPLKEPTERALLRYLVEQAAPVNPRVAARTLNQPTMKPAANVLCWLGLIRRCIRNDEATLFANCGMFNTWYAQYVARQ